MFVNGPSDLSDELHRTARRGSLQQPPGGHESPSCLYTGIPSLANNKSRLLPHYDTIDQDTLYVKALINVSPLAIEADVEKPNLICSLDQQPVIGWH